MNIDQAWQELLDKDDRTSPEEYPEMCLITRDELAEFMASAAPVPDNGERCLTCGRTDAQYKRDDWTCADPWHADAFLRRRL